MIMALLALTAVLLDWRLGEPRKWHPLIYFGRLADAVEGKFYGKADDTSWAKRLRGVFAVLLLIVPLTVVALWLSALPFVGPVFSVLILYLCIGHKSLHDHARPVVVALNSNNTAEARRLAGCMVSRDTESLNIIGAVTESVLENGNDAVFGTLFWFAIAGAPGAILYRLANTLDAMWGYRNDQYRYFGWAAARFDDLLNYLPARLTALTYALVGKTQQALLCWRTQAPAWDSPNAGPVMAAGAGALGIGIGGAACYRGEWQQRPVLGVTVKPKAHDIERALILVRHGVLLWLGCFVVAGIVMAGFAYA
jgi:adenosylcobinamide-phosphate synthase